jgi:hypothetical protein
VTAGGLFIADEQGERLHPAGATCAGFLGHTLVAGTSDGSVVKLDPQSGDSEVLARHGGPVRGIASSLGWAFTVSWGDSDVLVWTDDGVPELDGRLVLAPDEAPIACASIDGGGESVAIAQPDAGRLRLFVGESVEYERATPPLRGIVHCCSWERAGMIGWGSLSGLVGFCDVDREKSVHVSLGQSVACLAPASGDALAVATTRAVGVLSTDAAWKR